MDGSVWQGLHAPRQRPVSAALMSPPQRRATRVPARHACPPLALEVAGQAQCGLSGAGSRGWAKEGPGKSPAPASVGHLSCSPWGHSSISIPHSAQHWDGGWRVDAEGPGRPRPDRASPPAGTCLPSSQLRLMSGSQEGRAGPGWAGVGTAPVRSRPAGLCQGHPNGRARAEARGQRLGGSRLEPEEATAHPGPLVRPVCRMEFEVLCPPQSVTPHVHASSSSGCVCIRLGLGTGLCEERWGHPGHMSLWRRPCEAVLMVWGPGSAVHKLVAGRVAPL